MTSEAAKSRLEAIVHGRSIFDNARMRDGPFYEALIVEDWAYTAEEAQRLQFSTGQSIGGIQALKEG
jgi:hypothetical protein